MGTDAMGRDVFRRLLQGGRMTMTVGAIAVIISTLIGVIVGGISGYKGGKVDAMGRDVFRRLLQGGRMTMTVGAIAVIISTLIGVIVGGISGYKGGKVDNLLMRFTEIVSSIPFLPFAIILSTILGNKVVFPVIRAARWITC